MKVANQKIYNIIVLMLICAFAVMSIGITILGVDFYQKITDASDTNFYHRTSLSYIVNQLRRSDEKGLISIGKFGESDAIFINEEIMDTSYVTILYALDGSLRELYQESNLALEPSDGIEIMDLDNLYISEESGLITLVCENENQFFQTSISPRTEVSRRE